MQEKENKYYLGIDWGLKRSGLAIADDEVKISSCVGDCETSTLVDQVEALAKKFDFQDIVLGYSDIIKSDQQDKIQDLAKELKEKDFIVHMEEEFFSTLLAQQNLKETGKKGISKDDNAESARIILQGWIDKKL